VEGARTRAEAGDLVFGNIDTWCIWNLTGGTNGGQHVTDVSNASRTMLMNLETLDWDDSLMSAIGVPRSMLPAIRPSSAVYGDAVGTLAGIPVAGDLGDQQAATFGQAAYDVGKDRTKVYSYERPPAEFAAEETARFKANAAAWAFFQAAPPWYRKVSVHRVASAKGADTRARRLDFLIDASAQGLRLGSPTQIDRGKST